MVMNNYESPNVAEIGSAAKLIRGSKYFSLLWIDSQLILDYIEWPLDDIDETDD